MLMLFLALAVTIFLLQAALALLYRYPLDYGEAPLVDQAMRLAAGQNIYRADISTPPYTVSNYPPLYVLSLAPFVKLFGPSFFAGRVISVLCTLASAIFLGRIIYGVSQDRGAAAVTGMLFLSFPYVAGWSKLLRVDMLALALSTAGLYTVVRRPATRRGLIISGLLLVAAIYTRQSYALAAPLAAFAWLWAHDRRQAIRLAGLVGGLSLVLFLVMAILTRGGFYFNIVTANVNEFDTDRLGRWLGGLWETTTILLVLGGALLLLAYRRVPSWPLVAPYLIGALLSALTIGKIGSNENYFLELSAALGLTGGAAVVWSRERPWLRAALPILLALQTGMLMSSTLNGPVEGLKWRIWPARDPTSHDIRNLDWLAKSADGPVLADEFMGFLTLHDRPLYIQPFEITQLANAGLWDQTALLASIRSHEFPAILIHHYESWPVYQERWTPEMLSAIMESYTPTDWWAETIVYRPRDAEEPASTTRAACPGAPWRLPTRSELGVWWLSKQLGLMGQGYENTVPVFAVAEGLLMRRSDWHGEVAIQHDDPLRPGEKVWTFYGGMASGENDESFVTQGFPPGSEGVPVQRGELIGYQGQWSLLEPWQPTWVHLQFAVAPALSGGAFPTHLAGMAAEQPVPGETDLARPLDPSPYLGTVGSPVMGAPTWMPLCCQVAE